LAFSRDESPDPYLPRTETTVTTFTTHSTLADIVTARPSLARVLEARGLDYCCGGSATLRDACAVHQLDADAVLADLTAGATGAAAETAPEWATMSVVELVDHLESTHHQFLWTELPRLSALAEKVLSVHGERHPELNEIAACYLTLREDLEPHLTREERMLFPMVRELAAAGVAPAFPCGSLRNPISVLLADHDTVGELLAHLRELTKGYQTPADGCASYAALFAGLAELEADTHLHVHKENNVLLPAVVALEQQLAS
jgi:regulator of cell morphogenesis and NO signaling